ncbi:hypothetical protein EVAR_64884_1 [Eumeta japonica]|uniref:Uncharacterized protein n=1 Tax=Eumeta variegata TaxID=151549 RepID=A0A4C1ZX24_EUMVA|nr:hypothetical protein EVAR_64884_1 [Eumeta japonica]
MKSLLAKNDNNSLTFNISFFHSKFNAIARVVPAFIFRDSFTIYTKAWDTTHYDSSRRYVNCIVFLRAKWACEPLEGRRSTPSMDSRNSKGSTRVLAVSWIGIGDDVSLDDEEEGER